jgi:solute:Na+ symporter, SSS family
MTWMSTFAATAATADTAGSLSSHFTAIDWAVLVGYLLLVSILGVKLAGKQENMEDFFRGGGKLPWYAVSGSMIATIISAVTFLAVPARIFRVDGNFTYLQFGIIAGLLSRIFVSFVLVPAYFKHKVYSPYDYMGLKLGETARTVTTLLFSLMGLLAQAARVYITAVVLDVILHDQLLYLTEWTHISGLAWAVIIVGVIAVIWTMLGGIATVIWTDVMLFLVFVIGAVVALWVVVHQLPGGWDQLVHDAGAAGKFKLWSIEVTKPIDSKYASMWGEVFAEPFTIWAAIFAVTFGNIGAYGTDQLLAQRIFCCKSEGHAKLAVMTSWAAEAVAALMLLVGAGLWVFYQQFPDQLSGEAGKIVAENKDTILPVFSLLEVPVGLTGLIIAGVFAAAISSLTSILAALSQTTISALYLPLRGIDPDSPDAAKYGKEILKVSRGLIVFWGIALCGMAILIDVYVEAMKAAGEDVPFLDLALGLASYVIGALLATFLLAWLPLKKNAYGLIWAAPLSVFGVFASRFHQPWAVNVCLAVVGVLLLSWVVSAALNKTPRRPILFAKTIWLVAGCLLLWLICKYMWFGQIEPETGATVMDELGNPVKLPISWPWYAVIGGFFAFVFGFLLGEPHEDETA